MTTTLFEGVLNDDIIEKIGENKYRLTYWTYATCWSNNRHDIYFKTIEGAVRHYLRKFSDRVLQQGKEWLKEDNAMADTPEECWKDIVWEQNYYV